MGHRPEHRSIVQRLVTWSLGAPEPILRLLAGEEPVVIDGRVLNRRVQAILGLGLRLGRGEKSRDVETSRREMGRITKLAMPNRTAVHVVGRVIPGPGGPLSLRVYRRYGSEATPPAVVYLHGGGWISGDLDSHDGSCRLLADESGCVVVAVDYRLAPEHPFPAAVEDALAAYRWVQEEAGELSIEPGRVGVMGDSAGGGLAAVVAQEMRDSDLPAPVAQCLVYPGLDMTFGSDSYETMGHGPWLDQQDMAWFRSLYLPDESSWTSPLTSPAVQPDLAGLAPAYVIAAGFDPLRDDASSYARALAAAGVPVRYRCYDDMIHGFFGMGILPEAMAGAVEICQGMGELMREKC